MNKVRMIAIGLLLVGILISFVFYKEESEHEFIAGVHTGAGAALLITAKYFKKLNRPIISRGFSLQNLGISKHLNQK